MGAAKGACGGFWASLGAFLALGPEEAGPEAGWVFLTLLGADESGVATDEAIEE